MATLGTLAAFEPKNQTWDENTDTLEQFFAANEIDNADRQKAILIDLQPNAQPSQRGQAER